MSLLPPWANVASFLTSKKFLVPAGVIALLLAIGVGTYFYLNKQTNKLVNSAVENVNLQATNKTLETQAKVQNRAAAVDVKMDALKVQTTKDYEYVRNQIQSAPAEQKAAAVPSLIIDTINELDRLRQNRDAGGVPDDQVPVG